ncbi:MAG TPA: PP2C family protein-serine/threonine phosphatase, partial [Ardenticatenaceae bacterium]|nr:PP2C family protein-serine/threonine phosphatase [Ardenticatenaceae bacterium]
FSRPAQIVGGDYFDFLRFRDGSYGLAIADVAGKGMAASLLMASLQTLLRSLAPESDSTAEVVERLNRLFCHNIHFTTFVTLFLGRLDPATHVLDYCNAGHNPPILFRPGSGENSVSWLRPTGPAIALSEGARFDAVTLALSPGDTLLLYTDGVTEACDSQQNLFGYDRLAAFVQERVDLPVSELTRALRQTLDAYCEGQPLDDDTTIVVCKIVSA